MEPAVAAAYGVETAVEGAVVAGVAVAKSTLPLKGAFKRIPADPLPRAGHSLSLIKGRAYIFGGVEGEKLADNALYVYTLPSSTVTEADFQRIESGEDAPAARSGHAAAAVGHCIYVFGGQDGNQKLLDEDGAVFCFDTLTRRWSRLQPEGAARPIPRAFCGVAASIHPTPSVADPTAASHGTLFLQGGRTAAGKAGDLWSFDIAARVWTELSAPERPNEGGCMALWQNKLYRFGGDEARVEFMALAKSTFDDKGGKGEMAVFPTTGEWKPADNATRPGERSFASMHPMTTGQGRNYLLLYLGSRGSDFCGDVWSLQLQPEGMTGASVKDAIRGLVGAKTSEGAWAEVALSESGPGARAMFASDCDKDFDALSVVIWGGRNSESVMGDGWVFTLGPN